MWRPILASVLGVLFVVAFVALIGTQAIETKLTDPDYYTDALDEADAYEKFYEALETKADSIQIQIALLGGLSVPAEAIVDAIEAILPPDTLEQIVNAFIDHLVEFLVSGGESLDLSVDITEIVNNIEDTAVANLIREVGGTTVTVYADFVAFTTALDRVLEGLGIGDLPDSIPHFEMSRDEKDQVSAQIVEAAKLDPNDPDDAQVIDQVEQAVDNNDIAAAIEAAAHGVIQGTVDDARESVSGSPWVHEQQVDGQTHYVLAAPDEMTQRVEDRLRPITLTESIAYWGRFVALGLMVAIAAGLALLFRKRRRAALIWVGAPMIAAGAVALSLWIFGLAYVRHDLDEVLYGDNSSVPLSMQDIIRSTLRAAAGDLGTLFWVPSIVLILLGAALIVTAFVWKSKPTQSEEALAA